MVKITDFGLAKKLDESGQTRDGAVMGTPSYMAPEQAQGRSREIGPLSDVYALGAILYELLTGRPPFRAATMTETIMQVIGEEPVPPRQLNSRVPRDLETIALKCLRKEPGKRYASAAALAEDLRRWLANEPILARPVGVVERALKWVRRRPLWAALGVAVVALVIAIVVYTVALGKALDQSSKNLALADANQRRLRQAMKDYFIETSQSHLLNVPGLQSLRNKLLEDTLEFYQGLARQYGDAPEIQEELAEARKIISACSRATWRGPASCWDASLFTRDALPKPCANTKPPGTFANGWSAPIRTAWRTPASTPMMRTEQNHDLLDGFPPGRRPGQATRPAAHELRGSVAAL